VNSHPTDTPLDEVVRSAVGPYPDPLFPLEKEIVLEASLTEALWVSVFAPKETRAGTYRGMVEVNAGKRKLRLSFQVQVFAATVPKEQQLWVTNWFWFEHELMAKHYPKLKSDSDRYWRVLENIGRTMAEYKQNVVFVPVRTLAKAQLADGAVQYDFSLVDRWIETFDKAGMAHMIEGGHLSGRLGGGYDSPYVIPTDLVENGQMVRKDLAADDPRAEHNLREFLRQLRDHLKEKGWLSRYVQHVHDEPHGTEMPIDGVLVSMRLEVMREGIEDYELLMESARHAPAGTDALARAVMPTFTDYLRDVTQFRKAERELLRLATEAHRE